MAALVWFTIGIALWHFTVFMPDRFRGGIVGAFCGAIVGAMISGAVVQIGLGDGIGETDVVTALAAVPGTVAGLALTYFVGARHERLPRYETAER
jgi:hypothetical protein